MRNPCDCHSDNAFQLPRPEQRRCLIQRETRAALFLTVGEFSDLSTSFYYSAENFTTLGYDVVMSREWRLLGPLEAVAGMLMFSISTAVLFTVIQTLIQLREDVVPLRSRPGAASFLATRVEKD
jgi:hypothetical protein